MFTMDIRGCSRKMRSWLTAYWTHRSEKIEQISLLFMKNCENGDRGQYKRTRVWGYVMGTQWHRCESCYSCLLFETNSSSALSSSWVHLISLYRQGNWDFHLFKTKKKTKISANENAFNARKTKISANEIFCLYSILRGHC